MIKSRHSTGPKPARGYSPRGAAACYTRSAETAASPWPGDSAQREKRHARPVGTRAVRACGGMVAHSTAARWGLVGSKVLPVSTGGVPGRPRARRVETGLTEAVGRRKTAGAAVFNGGGVAPVVIDVRGGVLQHRCGRGKMGLSPIWEW
jgi:hypothetical protein